MVGGGTLIPGLLLTPEFAGGYFSRNGPVTHTPTPTHTHSLSLSLSLSLQIKALHDCCGGMRREVHWVSLSSFMLMASFLCELLFGRDNGDLTGEKRDANLGSF